MFSSSLAPPTSFHFVHFSSPIFSDLAGFHFGEVHHGAGYVVHVVRKDVQRDISDGLDNFAIRQTGGACMFQVGVADFAALHDDVSRQFQDGFSLGCRRDRATCVGDFFLQSSRLCHQ